MPSLRSGITSGLGQKGQCLNCFIAIWGVEFIKQVFSELFKMKFNPHYEDLQNPNKQNRGDLFDENGQLIMFQNLTNSETSAILYFKWMQIVDALPSKWRTIIRNSGSSNLKQWILKSQPQNVI